MFTRTLATVTWRDVMLMTVLNNYFQFDELYIKKHLGNNLKYSVHFRGCMLIVIASVWAVSWLQTNKCVANFFYEANI